MFRKLPRHYAYPYEVALQGNIHPGNDERVIRNASKEKKHEQPLLPVNNHIFIDNAIFFSKSTFSFRQDKKLFCYAIFAYCAFHSSLVLSFVNIFRSAYNDL